MRLSKVGWWWIEGRLRDVIRWADEWGLAVEEVQRANNGTVYVKLRVWERALRVRISDHGKACDEVQLVMGNPEPLQSWRLRQELRRRVLGE